MSKENYTQQQLKTVSIFLLLIFALTGYLIWGNKALVTTHYTVSSSQLPASFNGFKIAQVSDLHNAEFGENNQKLLDRIKAENPDIIVLTGDLIDSHKTRVDVAIQFGQQAQQIAPTYFITGNHEAVARDADQQLETALTEAGITLLHNENSAIQQGSDAITIAGVDDPSYVSTSSKLDSRLNNALNPDNYNILLAHHPEQIETYAAHHANLVLSGHAHGGQIRLPFIGGVIAPDQGFFPHYDAGTYDQGNTTMVLSRGLGNSLIPLRISNRPELVLVTMQRN